MRALLLALLIPGMANAAPIQLVPRFGFEKNAFQYGAGAAERLYSLGAVFPLSDPVRLKAEVGGWISKGQDGRKSSLYASFSWGFRAVLKSGLFGEVFLGPTYLHTTDSQLGGHFQIHFELGAGIMTDDGWGLGVAYGHFSSAGIEMPNEGKDFGTAFAVIRLGGS